MRTLLHNIFFFAAISFAFSCGKSGAAKTEKTEEVGALASTVAYSEEASGGNTCLLGYADKLDQLLTAELASEIAGMPADKSEKKYFDKLKSTANHHVEYRWTNGRMKNMKEEGMDMVLPVKDVVKLDGIKPRTLKDFKTAHKAPTGQQISQTQEKVDEAFDKKSGDAEIDEKVDKLDKMNVEKSTQKSVAKEMTGVFAKVAGAYSDVSGVGEAAS